MIENLSDVAVSQKLFEVPLYRYFVGLGPQDSVPDDTTISYFRVNRMGEEKFRIAFEQIVSQLHLAGLIEGKIQTQDATDVRGNIALINVFQLVNKGRLNILKAIRKVNQKKYEKLLKKSDIEVQYNPANKQKHFEDLIAAAGLVYDAVKRSSSLRQNKEIQKEMELLGRILEERKDECFDEAGQKQKKEDEDKITGKMINPSDPDASWGAKSDKKFFAGYKLMSNMDNQYGIITSLTVEKAGEAEEKYAAWLLERQKDNIDIVPEHFVADAKYDFGNTRVEVKAQGVENIYIPLVASKNKKGKYLLDDFSFEDGTLTCPQGCPAESMSHLDSKLGFEFRFNVEICALCEKRKECTTAKKQGRRVLVSASQLERWSAVSFNVSEEYALVMKGERYKIEPKQSDLKNNDGMKRARYRGLGRVRIQAYLAVTCSNLKKWFKYITGQLKNGTLKTLSMLAALGPPTGRVCSNTA